LIDPILQCSPQIYAGSKMNGDNIVPLGTAVLIKHDNLFFLVTAKHVFDKTVNHKLFIPLANSFLPIEGNWKYFRVASKYDNVDIAMLKIHEILINPILGFYKFLPTSELIEVPSMADDNLFIVVGFPAKGTNAKGKKFTTNTFAFITTEVHLRKLKKIQLNTADNIIVKYSRKEQGFLDSTMKSQGPNDLRGISGGGLWHFTGNNKPSGARKLSLAGIIIEADTNRGIICGTRTHWIRLLIQGFQQELNHI
jgi:hypothetical protein